MTHQFVEGLQADEIDLPRLLDQDLADNYASTLDTSAGATTSVLTFNLIIDILLGSTLKLMWGMVNILQFICYFSETKSSLSAAARFFLKKLKIIALGEFIPIE